MFDINVENCFDPKRTDASVNIVYSGFRIKYCKEFLAKYHGTKNYICSGNAIKNFFTRTMYKIRKNQDNIYESIRDIENCKNVKTSILLRIVAKLIQILPSVAVGPEILDPIIIEVNNETLTTINKVVTNYSTSPIRPIIILLLDGCSDDVSVSYLLKNLPINLKVAIHYDSGNTEIKTILTNSGAESVNDFLDAYASQCFYTCGNTDRQIIVNGIGDNEELNLMSAFFMKCHSSLLIDNKISAIDDISSINDRINKSKLSTNMLNMFKCINNLNNVYATDTGGQSICEAINYSKESNDKLLQAFVKRYAHFFPNTSYIEKQKILNSAVIEFDKNNMIDHKIYCFNNSLSYSFYTYELDVNKFKDMLSEAVTNVPGLAGMSILYNNVGTAELYNRNISGALTNYKIGLDNAIALSRPAQRIGLLGNIAIAETLLGHKHTTQYFIATANDIMHMPNTKNLPFIQINGLMNLLAVALYEENYEAMRTIRLNSDFIEILKKSLLPGKLGTGSLTTQIKILSAKSKGRLDFNEFIIPKQTSQSTGLRYDYILENGFNPAIANAWL